MARLTSGKFSFEFQYTRFEQDWLYYQCFFLWDGQPVVNDAVLKRHGIYWNSRAKGAFLARDDEADDFLPFLKKVLDNDQADYWEPIEPDWVIALYPEQYFPFLKSHLILVREGLATDLDKSATMFYTLIVFVDSYNFKDAVAYDGQGLALHLIVERPQLEAFVHQLETEYRLVMAG